MKTLARQPRLKAVLYVDYVYLYYVMCESANWIKHTQKVQMCNFLLTISL